MSTTDQHHDVTDATVSSQNPKKNSSGWTIFLFFAVGFIGSLLCCYIFLPDILYSKNEQPIDFNHALHMGVVYDGCNSCHYFRNDGTFSGIPDSSACSDCHQVTQGADPEEEKFVNEYILAGKEVEWLSYYRQPDCVFFSHAAHVKGAKMACKACHGGIGWSEHTRVHQKNRLTGYSREIWGYNITRIGNNDFSQSMKMNDCAKCHAEETGYKGYCFQCHK